MACHVRQARPNNRPACKRVRDKASGRHSIRGCAARCAGRSPSSIRARRCSWTRVPRGWSQRSSDRHCCFDSVSLLGNDYSGMKIIGCGIRSRQGRSLDFAILGSLASGSWQAYSDFDAMNFRDPIKRGSIEKIVAENTPEGREPVSPGNHLALGHFKAPAQRRPFPTVAILKNKPNVLERETRAAVLYRHFGSSVSLSLFEIPQQVSCAVAGAVIDYQHFFLEIRRLNADQHLLDVRAFVIDRNDNRDRHAA